MICSTNLQLHFHKYLLTIGIIGSLPLPGKVTTCMLTCFSEITQLNKSFQSVGLIEAFFINLWLVKIYKLKYLSSIISEGNSLYLQSEVFWEF